MDFACLKGGQFVVIVLNEQARNLKTIVKKKFIGPKMKNDLKTRVYGKKCFY